MFLFRGSKSSALESLESKRRLAILRKDVTRIVKHLTENAKSYYLLTLVEICRLKIRFNAKNVFEFEPSLLNGYDAYIKNKENIYIPRLFKVSTEDFEDQILDVLARMADSGSEIGLLGNHHSIIYRMMLCIKNMAKPPNLCLIRPIFAARCIQRWWRKCITNPQYKICRKRLFQEWSELTSPLY